MIPKSITICAELLQTLADISSHALEGDIQKLFKGLWLRTNALSDHSAMCKYSPKTILIISNRFLSLLASSQWEFNLFVVLVENSSMQSQQFPTLTRTNIIH